VEVVTESDSFRLDGGSVGGIVVGACASLLLILFCVFLWRRRRRPITIENPLATADQGTGLITFHTPTLPAAVEQYQPLSVSSNTALLQPPSASTPSPSHSNSSASNSGSRSRLVLDDPNPSSSGVLGPAQESAPASENTRPHQAPGYVSAAVELTFHPFTNPTIFSFLRLRGHCHNKNSQVHGFVQTPWLCHRYPKAISATYGCKWRVDRKILGPSLSCRILNMMETFYRQITIRLRNLFQTSDVDYRIPFSFIPHAW